MNFERPNIRAMEGYSYGEQPSDAEVVKLNTNELPFPPSPKVAEVLQNFAVASLRRYPPALANDFRDAAANLHNLDRDNIIATRGGDELLRLLFTTFTDPGDVVAMTDPTYSLYPVLAKIQDVTVTQFPMDDDYRPLENFAQQANQAGAKMTFLVNPHAPSGSLLTADQIAQFADQLDSLLLVDEAYVDFVSPEHEYNCLELVNERDDIIFLRTMSKGYGLAGLRFGYGIAHTNIIAPMLTKTRDSYNLDAIGQAVATAALLDQEYAQSCWQKVREQRQRLCAALRHRQFKVAPSEANFLLATVPESGPDANTYYLKLKRRNVLVRFFNVGGLDNKLRISIGSAAENDTLLACLDEIRAGHTD